MRQADYTDEQGNRVYEIAAGIDVFQSPDGQWHKATLADEAGIEEWEARQLIEAA